MKWKFTTGAEIDGSPALAADGTVYFGSTDGNLYALRPDGSERWRLHTDGYTASTPVLDEDGNLYLAANKNHISVKPTGELRWQSGTDVAMELSPLVCANGEIYVSMPWLHLGMLDRAGYMDWGFQMTYNLAASPNVNPQGILYACDATTLFALKPVNAAPLVKSAWPMWRANPQHTGRVQQGN